MGVPLLLQFSIALFTGMVAATFIPPVRKAIPGPLEILLWVAFVTVCVLGVASVTDAHARELTNSVIWGADQIINTLVGLMLGGFAGWVSDHRFSIGSWLVIAAGADIFALMFIASRRSAQPWQPRVHLREWMELPIVAPERVLPQPDPLDVVNRRVTAWSAMASAAAFAKSIEVSLWLRDAMPRETQRLAHASEASRVESWARLDSLREIGAHLGYAARSWFAAAGEPVLNDVAVRTARAAKRTLKPAALKPGEIVDIQARLGAQSVGWYGPIAAEPKPSPGGKDAAESQRSNRLAS